MSLNLKDYAHASRLFVGDNYRLSPKTSFLFHAFIDAGTGFDGINPNSNREIGLMVKQADLPRFTADTKTLHAYNRPNIIQTKIRYDPVTLVFHDDNANVVRNFWIRYFKYYFRDSDYSLNQHSLPYVYTNQLITNFGLSPRGLTNYIRSIRLYSLHQKKFTEYIFVNPIIKGMRFGNHNKQTDSDILQAEMTIEYEAVLYSGGTVTFSNPPGFADLHYDYSKSPLGALRPMTGDNGISGSSNLQQRYSATSSQASAQYNTIAGLTSARSSQIYNSSLIDMTNSFNSMLRQSNSSRVLVPNLAGTNSFVQGPFTGIGARTTVAPLAGAPAVLSTASQNLPSTRPSEITQAAVEAGISISNFVDSFPPDSGSTVAVSATSSAAALQLLNDIEQNSTTDQVDINLVIELRKINSRIEFLEKTIAALVDTINDTNEQVNSSASLYNSLNQKYNDAKNLSDGTAGKEELISQLEKQINFQLNLVRDNTDFYNNKVAELSERNTELEELKARRDLIK